MGRGLGGDGAGIPGRLGQYRGVRRGCSEAMAKGWGGEGRLGGCEKEFGIRL